MRFVIFKGEKSVDELAARIFRIPADGSRTATHQAADALVKANPQLAYLDKLPLGSLITIPDQAPPICPDELAVAADAVRSMIAQEALAAFDAMQHRLSDIESSAVNQLKSAIDRIDPTVFKTPPKRLSDGNAELLKRLPNLDSVPKDIEKMIKAVKSAQKLRKKSQAQFKSLVKSFAKK